MNHVLSTNSHKIAASWVVSGRVTVTCTSFRVQMAKKLGTVTIWRCTENWHCSACKWRINGINSAVRKLFRSYTVCIAASANSRHPQFWKIFFCSGIVKWNLQTGSTYLHPASAESPRWVLNPLAGPMSAWGYVASLWVGKRPAINSISKRNRHWATSHYFWWR
jgi:hypothetical protein